MINALTSKWVTLVSVIAVISSASAQTGEQYEVTSYTIDGGGGRSSGGPYTLTGTIGQPDADWCRGGDYELLGGFWSGGPLCIVEFDDFARFAEHWLDGDLTADLNQDKALDFADVQMLSDYWLSYCPAGWLLK